VRKEDQSEEGKNTLAGVSLLNGVPRCSTMIRVIFMVKNSGKISDDADILCLVFSKGPETKIPLQR
jgi:hypothetical protein